MVRPRCWIWDEFIAFLMRPAALWVVVIAVMFAFFFSSYAYVGMQMTGLFGGIEMGRNDIHFGVMAWLLLCFSPLLLSGLYVEDELRRGAYSLLRIRSHRRWWTRKAVGVTCGVLACWLFTLGIALLFPVILGREFVFYGGETEMTQRAFIASVPLLYVNTLMFALLSILLRAITGDVKRALFIPVGIQLFTAFIGGFYPAIARFMPGSWGMVMRSVLVEGDLNATYGFEILPVIIVQGVIIVLIYIAAPYLLKRSEYAVRKSL